MIEKCSMALGLVVAPPAPSAAAETTMIGSIAAIHRAPADGGARRWRVIASDGLVLRAAPAMDAPALAALSPGSIVTNSGCVEARGRIWCEVRPLRGDRSGYVDAAALKVARGPDGVAAMGVDDSERRVLRGAVDATGVIPCARERGQAIGSCRVAVARSSGGDATALATCANGFSRRLYFALGAFVAANATMSGVGRDTDWRVEDGVHRNRVDDQRYEIPNALLFGP